MSCCRHLAIALALTVSALGSAAQSSNFGNFVPLASSVAAAALPESAPFQFGNASWTQRSIADRATQLAAGQFNSGSWDMIDSNRTGVDVGRYLFMGFETGQAGIQRYDRLTGTMTTLWNAPTAGAAVNFDAARWTPFGTYLTAEESWGAQPQPLRAPVRAEQSGRGHGRCWQPGSHQRHRPCGTRGTGVRQEQQPVLHRRAERRQHLQVQLGHAVHGATYFGGGTNAVLRVGDGSVANATGAFSWVPFTDASGAGLAGAVIITDPNGVTSVDGRATTGLAAFKGTGYQRPEDLEIQTRANGDQVLYVTATTTHEVYSINLATQQIRTFVSRATIDAATGQAVGRAHEPRQHGDRCRRQHLHRGRPARGASRHLGGPGCGRRWRGRIGQPLGDAVHRGCGAHRPVLRCQQPRMSRS